MKKTIFLSLPYTASIKNLISDKFLSEFKDSRLIIFSPVGKDKSLFFKKLKKYNVIYIKYNKQNILLNIITFLINNLKTINLLRKKKIQTLETFIKMHNNNCSNEIIKPFRFLNSNILKFLSHSKILISTLEIFRLTLILLSSPNYIYFFIKYRPCIFFTAHPFANVDLPLQQIANFLNLKKIALIHSWDNITSKFKMHFDYDKILVWNEIQKKQLKYIYDYSDLKIKVTGIPFVDDFVNSKITKKKTFFKKNRLDSQKKLITIFGTTEEYIPHLDQILKKIVDMTNKNEFDKVTQLWMRPHPTSKIDYKKIFNKKSFLYKKPPPSFVALDYKNIGNFKDENKFFINLIYHSDIIINFFSTTIIDAIYFDKPIINPLIEHSVKKNSCCSVNSYFKNWTHMRDIEKTKGVSLVYDYKSLKNDVNKYYKNKNFKKKNRKKIFNTQINFNLGFSRKKIAYEIVN